MEDCWERGGRGGDRAGEGEGEWAEMGEGGGAAVIEVYGEAGGDDAKGEDVGFDGEDLASEVCVSPVDSGIWYNLANGYVQGRTTI